MAVLLLLFLMVSGVLAETGAAVTFSSRLIHRFSEEVKSLGVSRSGGANSTGFWLDKRSLEYYQLLVSSDFQRQHMKLGTLNELLFPSEGSRTMLLGNDFAWLHYTWIDVGTPNVAFLVALDVGSDLLWLPCECVQCAPLSASYYSSLDRDMNEYSPSASSTSKHLTCSHQLCELGPNCKSTKESCPYNVNYVSEKTSTSGLLVQDVLHLALRNNNGWNNSVKAPVVLGCGMNQTGHYLDGAAPDGLMGLGTGEISVPSLLARAGLVKNSFSLCFEEDGSGRILFGDVGPVAQKYTPFLPLNGKYSTYIVGVEASCVGNSCLKQSGFTAMVDSGTSFTFLPNDVYKRITDEFDKRVNATRVSKKDYPWEYCYKSSTKVKPKVPTLTLMFSLNNSFVVHDPVFLIYGMEGVDTFCLAIQITKEDIGTIGHNFMTGYQMVFDRESLKLGWSHSNCQDLKDDESMPLSPNGRPSNPLPTNQQQSSAQGHAVAPAVAGRAPTASSASALKVTTPHFSVLRLLLLIMLLHLLAHTPLVDSPGPP
ncbi:hypothetical protein SAY87_009097 [Trapa incisa]|uniref:Peptidase A1 domain-containing protein n=1 Tax=Trapa incisa TaxID=236973 RepID=A0AAN7JUK1_9MYRT|nr:hypothetical protein SAY87_009097 [Trapa incisa]